MTDRYELRAADEDRDRVAEILREAHGEGRLSQDELLARVEATYGARTYGELDRLISDLPVAGRTTPVPQQRAPHHPQPVRAQSRGILRRLARSTLTVMWWIYGVVLAINVTVWLLVSMSQGMPEYFWPIWVAGPWGIALGAGEMAYRSRHGRN